MMTWSWVAHAQQVEEGVRSDSLSALVFLLPAAICLGAVFVFIFLRAVRAGQFDDLDDPPERMLRD
jgi:cbb3-type cytochrome oxidase maturation protein